MVFGTRPTDCENEEERKHFRIFERIHHGPDLRTPDNAFNHYLRTAGTLQRYTRLHEAGPNGNAIVLATLYRGVPVELLRQHTRSIPSEVIDLVGEYQNFTKSGQATPLPNLVESMRPEEVRKVSMAVATRFWNILGSQGNMPKATVEKLSGMLVNNYQPPSVGHLDIRVKMMLAFEKLDQLRYGRLAPLERLSVAKELQDELSDDVTHAGNYYELARDIEDECFEIRHPDAYKNVKEVVDRLFSEGQLNNLRAYATETLLPIVRNSLPRDLQGQLEMQQRKKHYYSIFKKLFKEQKDFKKRNWGKISKAKIREALRKEKVQDLFGVRFIIPTEDRSVLEHVDTALHDHFRTALRYDFENFVVNPKDNGYQSLHYHVQPFPNGYNWISVQARTRAMHDFAEYGKAHHGGYKGSGANPMLLTAQQVVSATGADKERLKGDLQRMLWEQNVIQIDDATNQPIVAPFRGNYVTAAILNRPDWYKIVGASIDDGSGKMKTVFMRTELPETSTRVVRIRWHIDDKRKPYHAIPKKVWVLASPAAREIIERHWSENPRSAPKDWRPPQDSPKGGKRKKP
ncbi:MAG: hypothetical protein V1708_01695 [Candidatus Micrarchaeota archaeon]